MSEITRIAAARRPWMRTTSTKLLSPITYLGLGLNNNNNFSTTSRRPGMTHRNAQSKAQALRREKNKMHQVESRATYLLPLTVIRPPIWRFPRSPPKFIDMLYLTAKNFTKRLSSLVGVYFVSMGSKGLALPKFRLRKSSSVPAAKALHAQMAEALASGDKDTLRRICTDELFIKYAGIIDSRPPGTRVDWELIRYMRNSPRLADFRVAYQPLSGTTKMKLVKQATVAIHSVQRLTRYEGTSPGRKISEREGPMTEHVVLQCEVDTNTWEAKPWKIWGFLDEMSYEQIKEDEAIFMEVSAASGNGNRKRAA
ncbi:hypothetical protein GGS20DRAFT_558774 [Poronia punctata]|nr:hypothetical protein GGS20DRAFT_558774 [Poronia punctata]